MRRRDGIELVDELTFKARGNGNLAVCACVWKWRVLQQ